MFEDNKNFYPTPGILANKMINKIDWNRSYYVLEPEAGKGDLVEKIREKRKRYQRLNIHCIEKDDRLRNMLIGAGEKVVGKDFLTYSGLIQFDTIIMNPPFDNGHEHLLKAIDLLYSGQIVCLLNAKTIRNPSNIRQEDLTKKLKELKADITYLENQFIDAERKTSVEIALIYINIERNVEDDLLAGAEDRAKEYIPEEIDGQIKDIALPGTIDAIVMDYNNRVKIGIGTITDFYKMTKYIGSYIGLDISDKDKEEDPDRHKSLTNELKSKVNTFLSIIRHRYWEKVLSLPEFEKRLTEEKKAEFRETIKKHSDLEFTVDNVRSFFENLIASYQTTLTDAAEKLFDKMTAKHHWDESIHCKNVHYYNGWKSNDAFKINKRVVMPGLGVNPFYAVWSNRIDYNSEAEYNDIDKVANFFEGKSEYKTISEALKTTQDIFQVLESEFFKIRVYKKGTTHLTWKSDDILRRFNIEIGKRKGWLPMDYGYTPFEQLTHELQEIVKSFEDNVEDYNKNLNQIGFAAKDLLMIEN